jgi:carbamoyltransferase
VLGGSRRIGVKILGISPLDKDATASLVEDGRVRFAAAEERFSRIKQHAGFPERAIQAAFEATGTRPADVDLVAYPFLDWQQETALIERSMASERAYLLQHRAPSLEPLLAAAQARVPERDTLIHGLSHPNQRKRKGVLKELAYRLAGATPPLSRRVALHASASWARRASRSHRHWQEELEAGLARTGLTAPLRRSEHHLSHAANAYLSSGFDRALVVTLDGYGSGLSGSISVGEGGRLQRLHGLVFPHSLGFFYEMVTSSLGFHPDRHAGKVVGLAAYGDPAVLSELLLSRADGPPGDLRLLESSNVYLSRHLAARFPIVDVAAAYQHVLETLACGIVRHWLDATGCRNVVLSGGVAANVKMNQRIHELEGVEGIFIYPNMGDGGCGTGLALRLSRHAPEPLREVYLGPAFDRGAILSAIQAEGLAFEEPADLARSVARHIHEGRVVARFDGRMEYGPRALGNRSILYHGREPRVNQWLNRRLQRTEFMPFAPVTTFEARHRCYRHVAGAEHAAEFMTITFDCTPWMKEHCPAAVHVDGTARPQLLRRETNPGYYEILEEYERLSGIPCLINTSFNMHEEPIVCTPRDALRAFLDGRIDGLAIGPYYVPNPLAEPAPGR